MSKNSSPVTLNVNEYVAPPSPTGKYRVEQPYLFQPIAATQVPTRLPDGNPLQIEGPGAIDGGGQGPTHRYISANLGWPWQKLGGDLLGSDLVAGATSPVPWASFLTNSATGAVEATYTVNLTAMAQNAHANNRWMAFKMDCPAAVRSIYSGAGTKPPVLTYNYTDGTSETLPVWVCATMAGSEICNTLAPTMQLPIAMEFKKPSKAVQSCSLVFTVTNHLSGNSTTRIFLLAPPVALPQVRLGLAQAYPLDEGMSAHPAIINQHRYNNGTTYADYCSTAPAFSQNTTSQSRRDPAIYNLGPEDLTKLPHLDNGKWIGPGPNSPTGWQVIDDTYTAEGFVPLAPGLGALRIWMPRDKEAFPANSVVKIVDGSYVASSGTAASDAQIFIPAAEFGLLDDISVRAYYRIGTPDGGPYESPINERYQIYKGRNTTSGALSAPAWLSCGGKWGITPMHRTTLGGNSGSSGGPFGFQMRQKWSETTQALGGPNEGGWKVGMHLFDFLGNNPPGYRYGGESPINEWMAQRNGFGGVLYAHKWYCIEIRVKLNSIDQPGVVAGGGPWIMNGQVQHFTPDGFIEVYLDGMLCYRREGMVFRSAPVFNQIEAGMVFDPANALMACRELGFTSLWNNWFHGGVERSGRDRVLFMTGLAYSRNGEYIGPMNIPTVTPPSVVNNLIAITGDSLTDPDFAQVGVSPINWALGRLGGKWDLISNTGLSGQSVGGCLNQLKNLSTDTYPGWADLPRLGIGMVRIGTNAARYGLAVTGFTAAIDDLVAHMLTKADRVVLLSIPPAGGIALPNQATAVASFNSYFQFKASQNPTRVFYIDDCVNVRHPTTGAALAPYFAPAPDEVHQNGLGCYQMGIDLAAGLQALMDSWGGTYPTPVLDDAANVYPAENQWMPNPTNVGTGGTKGAGWTGTLANGYNIASVGAGISGTVAIRAADVGDPNQTPWQAIIPTSCQAGSNIDVSCQSAGRAYTTNSPLRFKQVIQIRLVGVDSSKFGKIRMWMQDANVQKVTREHTLYFGDGYSGTIVNDTVTLVQNMYRRVPAAFGAGIARMYIQGLSSATGSMGEIQFRGWTIEG